MYPVVKWVGGKRQLLPVITKMIPEKFGNYFEPFLGGAALYLALEPVNAIINDVNHQLIGLYNAIKNSPDEFISKLSEYENGFNNLKNQEEKKQYFYMMRDQYNTLIQTEKEDIEMYAIMIFLNKSCFNGIYRVNKKGLYNVPFGRKNSIKICDENNIRGISKLLSTAKITSLDFEAACSGAEEGDFIFFDSPYYGTFDSYQAGRFSEEDHVRLSKLFKKLSKKGVYCMLTNSNTDFIKNLYKGYRITVVPVKRMINRDALNRTGEEIVVTNYSLGIETAITKNIKATEIL